MQNIPTSQSSVQSQKLEVTHNGSNSEAQPVAIGPLTNAPQHSRNSGAEKTSAKQIKNLKEEKSEVSAGIKNKNAETIPKSIRLWKSAFDALRVLKEKYGKSMVDMASIAIMAHAKNAAAAPIVRFRIMAEITLFSVQASASDIRAGLSNLRNDLYQARKSHRDPEERKALYHELSFKYQKLFAEVEKTLTLMNKECLLHDLIEPGDHQLLAQAVLQLKASKPITRTQIQIRDLYLKIFETLLLP